jgi:PPOX class probable F420-dependent enzyme
LRKKILTTEQQKYLDSARVARLATSDRKGAISLVPIVYATEQESIFFVVDRKAKRAGKTLKRLRNISENPQVTLLVDNFSEDWGELSYLMIHCRARVLTSLSEQKQAAEALKKKYAQYRGGGYFPQNLKEAVIVKLQPKRAIFWQNLHHSLA